MDTPQTPVRIKLDVLYLADSGQAKQIHSLTLPAIVPVPKVGDEISISKSMEDKLGTKETVFRVVKRRFPIQSEAMSFPSIVLFVSTESDDK